MGMFFFMISCRIIINIFPYYGLGQLSTFFVGVQFFCILMALYHTFVNMSKDMFNKHTFLLFVIFLIYSAYTAIYNFYSPQMAVDLIQSRPETLFAMFLSTFNIGCTLILSERASRMLDYSLFAKISVIIIVLSLVFYFNNVDYTLYALYRTIRKVDSADFMEENGLMSPLTINNYVAVAFVCNLICKGQWTNNDVINKIVYYAVSIYLFFIVLILGERGPLLFMITTYLFYSYAKSKLDGKYFVVIMLFLLFDTQIFEFISSFAPDIVSRTINIVVDGGSGRLGSDDSIYSLAVSQIMGSPFFGSYHRILAYSRMGTYPHNFVLESLMTFGLVFSIPLFGLMWVATRNAYKALKNDEPIGLFCLLFIHTSSCLLTSSTMFLNTIFWGSLSMTLTYRNK